MAKKKPKPNSAKKTVRRRPAKRSTASKERRPSKHLDKVDPASVTLEAGKGSTDRGGGPGGHYWHIHLFDTRVGYVYINELDEAPFGKHASIQIHINQTHRGRGIGSVAYRLACEQSVHEVIIATMRKSNLASQRAAAQAGFKVIEDIKIPQKAMRWTRSQQL